MKKSKFLLLGSVASLASIPFVARLNVVRPKKKRNQRKVKIQAKTQSLAKIQVETQSLAKIQVKTQSQAKIQAETQNQAKIQAETQSPAKIQVKKWTLETIWHQAQILKMATIKIHLSRNLYPLLLAIVTNN